MLDGFGSWPHVWHDIQRVGIAYILTALIGVDREREAHTAGIRTFPIVGMASCGYILTLSGTGDSGDQSRLLQGLITGIGFIGGGAILKDGGMVRGTATAASVWNAGIIGALVAEEHYGTAIALAALNLLTLRALLPFKEWLDRKGSRSDLGDR